MTSPSSSGRPGQVYLDDLHVGQRFVTRSYPVTAEGIIAFAREYDPQPFHLDPAAGEASVSGGLVASGWHTASISMRLLVEYGPPFAGGLIGVAADLLAPAHPPGRRPPGPRRGRGGHAIPLPAGPGHGHHPHRDQESA